MMMILKRLLSIGTVLALAACGGGGGNSGTSGFGGGGSGGGGTGGGGGGSGSPTVKVELSSQTVTVSSPATVTTTLLDSSGAPIANTLVALSTSGGTLATLGTGSVLTNAQGKATTTLISAASGQSGADEVVATATIGTTSVRGTAAFSVPAQAPSLSAVLDVSPITSTRPGRLTVTARDLNGNLVRDAVVSFTSTGGLASFSPASVATAADGTASTVVTPKTPTTTGADVVTASFTLQGLTARAQVVVQFTSDIASGTPTLTLDLDRNSISAASPATATATLRDAQGNGVGGQVVTFRVVRGLATTNVTTSLTQSGTGKAVAVLTPSAASAAGADEITASASYAGVQLQQTVGFQVQATPVILGTMVADTSPLSAYGQTSITLQVTGASAAAPAAITFSSSCVAQGKATISPSSVTATGGQIQLQYRDNGCGALAQGSSTFNDQIQAVVTATGATSTLALPIQAPASSSIAFVRASPEQIYLRGSGFTEASVVTFQVNDLAGNPLPNVPVELRLQTGAGGVTMEGRGVESVNPPSPSPFIATSNALGQVSVRVNSGTLPTPVRINARLAANTSIATVSSNLSVAVGLPSQLNFSLSQGTKNIEGYNIDGTTNTYSIIASDRSGNPVPAGTAINFVTEGGQIEASKQTQLVNGIARTSANFVSSEPRPVDGRITIVAYALGEESFIDLNGNNVWDTGEPFQDLGNVYKDRNFDGAFDGLLDEYIPLTINNGSACAAPGSNLLSLDASIPSVPGTCDGRWSGAGQVYVRRATQTVLSTSAARPLWASTSGLSGVCTLSALTMQVGPQLTDTATFVVAGGDTWYGGASGTLTFIAADANPGRRNASNTGYDQFPRLNPVAAGTTVTASTPTTGLTVLSGGGSPVPSTTEATLASVAYSFTDPNVQSGVVFVSFTSPGGTRTTVTVNVVVGGRPSVCPY